MTEKPFEDLQQPSREVLTNGESVLQQELRQERVEHRQKRARNAAQKLIEAGQFHARERFYFHDISPREQAERIAAQGSFTIEELVSEDSGVKTARVISEVVTGDKRALLAADVEGEVKPIGPGVDLVWSMDKTRMRAKHYFRVDEQVPIAERVRTVEAFFEKAEQSDKVFNAAMDEIGERVHNGVNEAYATQAFSLHENLYQIRRFLGSSNLYLGEPGLVSDARLVIDTVDRMYKLPHHYAHETPEPLKKEGIYFDENGRIQKVLLGTFRAGVYVALKSADPARVEDLTDLPMLPGIEIDTSEVYCADSFDGKVRPDTIPFIDTEAASELLGQFEKLGLVLSPQLRNAFTEAEAIGARFGHGYAYLTREIAKLVDDPDRSVSHLFNVQNADGTEDENALLQRLAQLNGQDGTNAARVVNSMLQDIARRQLGETPHTDMSRIELPASNERIDMRDGSCKDIEVYISSGSVLKDTPLLKSSYKVPTAICLEPVLFNGVRLPAGSLFRMQDDGTYLFMRVTSFAFSPEEALNVFGAQEAECRKNYNSGGVYIREMMRYE